MDNERLPIKNAAEEMRNQRNRQRVKKGLAALKANMKEKADNAPVYTIEPKPNYDNTDVIKENGAVIAEISVIKKPLGNKKPTEGQYPYYFARGSDNNTMLFELNKFKTKEDAFHFVVSVRKAYLNEITRRPLGKNLNQYIELQARTLRERTQAAVSNLHNLVNEKYTLLTLAREFGVKEAEVYVDDSDLGQTIDNLLSYKFGEHPFFSESCLYELMGKEDARTVLALLGKLIKIVAPEKAILL
jgi:hypothetical protein